MEVYRTIWSATSQMKLTTGTPFLHYTITSSPITLGVGDWVGVRACFMAASYQGYEVMVARYLTELSGSFPSPANMGNVISRPMAFNLDKNTRYGIYPVDGHFIATQARQHRFVLAGYTASTAARGSVYTTIRFVEISIAVKRA